MSDIPPLLAITNVLCEPQLIFFSLVSANMSSLADRIKECMAAKGLTNAALAKLAKVKPPTSFNWGSGKTKSIKGEQLLNAAAALGVDPQWLATGKGPKYVGPEGGGNVSVVQEKRAAYPDYDIYTKEAIRIMIELKDYQREGALAALRTHVQNLGPPRDGQTLHMAA